MNWLQYFVRPVAYLLAGGSVSVLLMRPLIEWAGTGWFYILLSLLLVTLLITTIGLVGVWVHYQTWSHEETMHPYSWRQLLTLHLRCFCCLAAGCLLAAVIHLLTSLLPESVHGLVSGWLWVAYALCTALTGFALLSIFRGETLQEVRLRHAQNENLWLRSQLNPHFLYNTLNNIDALIWTAPEKASEAVILLSGLMRYLTASSSKQSVPLSDEVELLKQLVELQRLRMASVQALSLSIEVDNQEWQIAPLLLMPLVENTFKHAGSLDRPDAIVISLSVHQGQLLLTTENMIKANTGEASKTTGVGLRILRRRLQLLYPGKHTLTTGIDGQLYRTHLEVTLN